MIQQFSFYTIVVIALLGLSCDWNSPTKVSDDNTLDKETRDQIIQRVEYGSGDVVTKGYLDKSGNMWFSTTREGVFKYDGESFVNFTVADGLCDNEVWAILEDKEGVLWFGTANGLCSYDGEKFNNIPIPENDAKSDWLEEGYPIINPNSVTSIIQAKNGVFWIGSNGGGAFSYDGKTFTSFLKNGGKLMPDSLYHNVILSIIEDEKGNIWFSSFSHGGVSKYDGTALTHYSTKDGLGDDMIATSYIDKGGKLWFGTRSGGMSYFDEERFITIAEQEGRCQNNMATLLEDKTGKLWMGSFARRGVCWYDGNSFIPFDVAGSEHLNDIKFISEDKAGNIWFGGRYGVLWRYDGSELKDFTHEKKNE